MATTYGFSELAQALLEKKVTKKELLNKVKNDFGLVPLLLTGVCHQKAGVRYSCSKVLLDISEEHPEKLYPHFDSFVDLLDSKYRILKWNGLAIIANLTRVDTHTRFDEIFSKYFDLLNSDHMITVANVVGNSGTIALAKPYLIPRITVELLKIENISVTPHLTEECKRVIAQRAIQTFGLFFDSVDEKDSVLSFVRGCLVSSRVKLRTSAQVFLEKWG